MSLEMERCFCFPTLSRLTEERGQSSLIDNAPDENVDVLHSNSSSECRLVIDFSRYFLNIPVNNEVVEGEDAIEVPPPTGRVDDVSGGETDYDEYDSEYDNELSDSDFEGSDGENV